MAAICSIFVLILSIVLGSLGFYTYYHNIVDQYQQYIETIIRICRSAIDADDMEVCIETGVKSEQYQATQEYLDNIKNHSQVEFIYVIKPLNDGAVDNAMYVWNAVREGEVEEFGVIDSLGDLSGEGFPQEMAAHFLEAMESLCRGRNLCGRLSVPGAFSAAAEQKRNLSGGTYGGKRHGFCTSERAGA